MERRVRAWQEERDDGDDDEEAAVAEEDAEPAEPEPKHDRNDLQVDAFADRLRSRLSTQVAIRPKKDGSGTVELEFYSKEDLERLLDLILET
jgi:ParB family chromosome partitioning protein